MKLRCINIDSITKETPFELLFLEADGLELNKVYTTQDNHPYQSEDCILLFNIDGIGERLAERFEVI